MIKSWHPLNLLSFLVSANLLEATPIKPNQTYYIPVVQDIVPCKIMYERISYHGKSFCVGDDGLLE